MYRNYLLLVSMAMLLFTTCSRDGLLDQEAATPQPVERLSKETINAFVLEKLESEGQFKWEMAPDDIVWSAISHGHEITAVGYQPLGFADIESKIHEIDIAEPEWRNVRDELMELVLSETQRLFPDEKLDLEDLLVLEDEKVIPAFYVLVKHPSILSMLRERADVRYVEPMEYSMETVTDRSDSGCGAGAASNIPTADYTTTSPSVKIPWNFYHMNIPQAWNTSQGDNIGVCLIDTGTSPNQPKLGSQFSSGLSTGRYINRYGTYVSSWWWWASPDGPNDQCGHGTQMAGLIAAPRGYNGTAVGVAYKSNLIAYRATGDVVVNGSKEKTGVKNALIGAGNRSDVKIISMSIGDVISSSTVADGIYYAYNRGKLIFAAAGTSLSWTSWWGVIFPANMSQTVAVTGIKDGSSMQRCNTCHDGSAVDFVAVMQRQNDNSRTSLTLATSGYTPAYVGGSSAATATTAGIAALVWGTNPNQSRSQVLNRLKNAASIYPNRDGNFGWGIIDAAYAVTH